MKTIIQFENETFLKYKYHSPSSIFNTPGLCQI